VGLYALSFNLLLGLRGLPSFGHGAYFGVGAYAFGLAQKFASVNLWLDLGAAVLAAALCGAVVAAFISHRRGIYYALMTIAFGQVLWFVAVKWHSVTGGEDGLLNLKRMPAELGFASIPLTDNVSLYYFVLAVSCLAAWLLWRIVHSPFGRVIQAIRQNETRAAFIGYNVCSTSGWSS
jgi:branched-chain amino acid transport system permease protein